MKFIADGMLEKLSRWLRLGGKNVVCINDLITEEENEDEILLELAEKESRILITSDLELHRKALRKNLESILIEETEDIAKQLLKITKSIGEEIEFKAETSLCPVCNGDLNAVEKTTISDEVPKQVIKENDEFWKCKSCGKIYWTGGHWEKIGETADRYERMKE